jgi:hypothetical protein
MNQRILEIALEELQRRKAEIDADIELIRQELGSEPVGSATEFTAVDKRRRGRSSAQRKAQSERMRKYWAARRTGSSAKVKTRNPKPRKSSSKAISEAMRAYWAKRKAAAGKKEK